MTELDPDAAQAATEHCYEQGWSDGLPWSRRRARWWAAVRYQ